MAAEYSDAADDMPRGVDVAGPPGYDALVALAALYRDGSRRVVRLTGARATDMLQGLITADIRDPGETGAAWPTLILTPKGRVLADAVVVRVGDVLLLDVPEAAWPDLEPHFGRYLPPRFARLEPAGLAVVRLRGPEAVARAPELAPTLAALPAPMRTEKDGMRWNAAVGDAPEAGETYAVRRDGPGGEGFDLYLPTSRGIDAPFTEVSAEAWEIWRIEQGIPLYGHDISDDNLPQETGLVADTTSFSKGCYTGQEVLARIHYRGKVNRHLRGVRAKGGDDREAAIAPGDELRDGARAVGTVTSAVRSPRFGWIGLGYVRREVEPGDELEAGGNGTAVVVEELPLSE